jgi:hypothetical protein
MMFGKDRVDSPLAMPDSLFQTVVDGFYLLRERCDFAHFCDAVDGRLSPSEPCGRRQL